MGPSADAPPSRLYLWIGLALALGLLAMRALRFGTGGGEAVDFDCFHVVARLAAEGRAADAYRFATLGPAMRAEGAAGFMPFTYPPPFELLLAPLGRLPRGAAYLLFVGASLLAFLWALRRVAGREELAGAMLVCLPVIGVNLACGQNGLLTGALAAFAALGLAAGRPLAGAALGLMVVKPHLAVALSLQAVLARRWAALALAAAVTLTSAAACALALGPAVWPAFLDGVREAGRFLEAGAYPLHRMASLYALLRGLGVDAAPALAAHAAAALLALAAAGQAALSARPRSAAGLVLLAGPLISPYVYDYDLAGFALGLVVLGSDLRRAAGARALAAVYGLAAFATLAGYALALARGSAAPPLPSVSAPALWIAAGLAWRLTRRAPAATDQAGAAVAVTVGTVPVGG